MWNDNVRKFGGGGVQCPGQQDHDSGSAIRFAFDVNQSAVCGDNTAQGGQSQTSTFARALGGEKRLEEMLACFGVHAAAVVTDSQKNAGKGGSTAAYRLGAGNIFKLTVGGLNDNATAVGQGVASVENEVEENLRCRGLIDRDQTQIRIKAEFEHDVFADKASQQIL